MQCSVTEGNGRISCVEAQHSHPISNTLEARSGISGVLDPGKDIVYGPVSNLRCDIGVGFERRRCNQIVSQVASLEAIL